MAVLKEDYFVKKLIYLSTFAFALMACSSTDSNSTDGNTNGSEFSCSVTKNANSVVMSHKYKDFEEVRTVTLNSKGESPYYTQKKVLPTVADAQKECQKEKDDDYYKDIECYGNTVIVGEPAEDDELEYYDDYYRRRCSRYEEQYKNGTLAEEYDKAFGR